MKSTTLLLIGGLAFAGVALAGDPAPQSTSGGTSLKVGIDANGNVRPLTSEESAALDAQAAASAGNTVMARSARTTKSASALPRLPATTEEAMANQRVVNGIVGFKPTEDLMSSVTVSRNADGTLVFAENGAEIPQPKAKEMASE